MNWVRNRFSGYLSDWEHLVHWSEEEENVEGIGLYNSAEYEDYVNDCSFLIDEVTTPENFLNERVLDLTHI